MEHHTPSETKKAHKVEHHPSVIVGSIVLGLIIVFLGYQNFVLGKERSRIEQQLADLQVTYASTSAYFERTLNELQSNLVNERSAHLTAAERLEGTLLALQNIQNDLQTEKQRAGAYEEQINVLKKLEILDKELLQKYSKVSFLNEHYVPQQLTEIESQYLLEPTKSAEIHSMVWPYLKAMFEAARNENIALRIVSAYRSFGEQTGLKATFKVVYGSGANQFSADQGFSEHQLGTTIDITTPAIGGTYTSFENTSGFAWLKQNAHKYGFILSYPKGNTYYIYEPWHWRFVGQELAERLYNEGKNFYDLDQRDIDSYLLTIFN